jgi:hypothetical protein
VVTSTFDTLSREDLEKDFPLEALGYKMTTEYFLIHLFGHLAIIWDRLTTIEDCWMWNSN